MIDIPLGKALVPVEKGKGNDKYLCTGCCLFIDIPDSSLCFTKDTITHIVSCFEDERKDGKNVIFKLVDYPVKETANGTINND